MVSTLLWIFEILLWVAKEQLIFQLCNVNIGHVSILDMEEKANLNNNRKSPRQGHD